MLNFKTRTLWSTCLVNFLNWKNCSFICLLRTWHAKRGAVRLIPCSGYLFPFSKKTFEFRYKNLSMLEGATMIWLNDWYFGFCYLLRNPLPEWISNNLLERILLEHLVIYARMLIQLHPFCFVLGGLVLSCPFCLALSFLFGTPYLSNTLFHFNP